MCLQSLSTNASYKINLSQYTEELLDRFYYSTSMSLVGTQKYDTIIRGNFLKETVGLDLTEMFIHTDVKKNISTQTLFQVFNIKKGKK